MVGRLIRFYYRLGFGIGQKYTDATVAVAVARSRVAYAGRQPEHIRKARVDALISATARERGLWFAYKKITNGLSDKEIFFSQPIRRDLLNEFSRGYFDARSGKERS